MADHDRRRKRKCKDRTCSSKRKKCKKIKVCVTCRPSKVVICCPQGATGPQGPPGARGATGPKGPTGAQGATGPQ
ncbi:hypothetical protein P9503_23880, partial [Brevibacillus laterosporus]|nr:hypothetical protein [Brevibacillus laterosporus]